MNTMTVDRLTQIIEAYGADPARWPETERDAAQRLVKTQAGAAPEFQDLLARHDRIDRALARIEPVEVSAHLRDQIVKIGVNSSAPAQVTAPRRSAGDVTLPHMPAIGGLQGLFAFAMRPAALYLSAGLIGIAIGLSAPLSAPMSRLTASNSLSDEDVYETAFAATDYLVPSTDGFSFGGSALK